MPERQRRRSFFLALGISTIGCLGVEDLIIRNFGLGGCPCLSPITGLRAARSPPQNVERYPEPTVPAPGCKGGEQCLCEQRRSHEGPACAHAAAACQ